MGLISKMMEVSLGGALGSLYSNLHPKILEKDEFVHCRFFSIIISSKAGMCFLYSYLKR